MNGGRKPSDYPQFAFRVSNEDKQEISELVEEVTRLYNLTVGEGMYMYRKNDIIVEALKIGLRDMKKNKDKIRTRKKQN